NVCNARNIPHPVIVSESGRAVAAYHSVLIFDALGSSALDKFRVTGQVTEDYNGNEELPQPVRDLFDAYRTVSERRLVECYHDALTAREQVLQMFNLGLLSLEFRGIAERLYWATCAKIRDFCRKLERLPEELEDLENVLSDTYFCNFSIFQSLPDSWAIDQLFPIMPIHRRGVLPARKMPPPPGVSAPADPSAVRATLAQGRARRHHLRLGRQSRSLRRSARCQ